MDVAELEIAGNVVVMGEHAVTVVMVDLSPAHHVEGAAPLGIMITIVSSKYLPVVIVVAAQDIKDALIVEVQLIPIA